jgi:uncharacterized protein YkwD
MPPAVPVPEAAAGAPSRATAAPDEQEIAAELNRLRTRPRQYAARLRAQRRFYRGKLLSFPGETPLRTREGAAALEQAIRALRRQKPLSPLRWSTGLYRAAREHARDIGKRGSLDHRGADGSAPHQRIARHGEWSGHSGENLDFGSRDPERVIMHLLVDDGVPDRGHRRNLLHPAFTHVGIACADHARFTAVCVMELAENYREH